MFTVPLLVLAEKALLDTWRARECCAHALDFDDIDS